MLLALGMTASCSSHGDAGPADAKSPFRILFISGQTGVLSTTAIAVGRGVQANVDYLNKNGGTAGRKLELTVKDDQSDPTRAVTLLQAALDSDKKPDLVIAGVGSNEALAMAPLLTRTKTIGIASVASALVNDTAKYPYFFSEAFPASDSVTAAAVFLQKKGGVTKVALVAPSDAIGDATAANFNAAFSSQGVTAQAFRFAADAVDFTPVLQKTVAFKPDWIFMEGSGAQVPILLSSREKAGADAIPTIAGATASSQPLLTLGKGNQLNNLHATLTPNAAYIEPDKRTPEFNAFFTAIQAQGPFVTSPYVYSVGWDNVGIWASAVGRVQGDVTGEKVKAALEAEPAKAAGAQFPVYSGQYTTTNHMHGKHPEDFTFAQLASVKDNMLVIKP